MEIALALLALSLLVFAVSVLAVVRGVRAARRGIERAGREVRRTIGDATLAARSAQPGPVGELARTRRELRACIEGTRNTLRLGSADDPALGEALALFRRLEEHHRHLDGEMGALMSGEPSRARVSAGLPELRKRAEDIKRSAEALRFAAQDRARRHDAEALDTLRQQIDMEASALRHWAPVEGADGAGDGARAVPEPPGARGAQGGRGAPGAAEASAAPGRREPGAAAGELGEAGAAGLGGTPWGTGREAEPEPGPRRRDAGGV
ncbi:hypothetical protein [Streptomyces marincola]|uniref:hypothetical protein n=1 Tax=Streptomyces marincola TaxID=2878388 RepID=UPI00159C77C6|nr:hypothetical protein [Streptomyces marincola]